MAMQQLRSSSLSTLLYVSLAATVIIVAHAQIILQSTLLVPDYTNGERRDIQHRLILFAQDEPVDVVEQIRAKYHASRDWRHAMLVQICNHPKARCTREKPLVFSTKIQDAQGSTLGELAIVEDEEPVDALALFAAHHHLPREARLHILGAICAKPEVRCLRHRSLVFRQRITSDAVTEIGVLEIYDDTEPVDQIYRFVADHELPVATMGRLVDVVCERVACERHDPVIFSKPIAAADGQTIGRLDIPYGHEPADIVYRFGYFHGLQKGFRQQLLTIVCSDKYVTCKRTAPYVFTAPIVVENGTSVGTLNVLEEQELADAVYRFAHENEISRELQISLLQQLCGQHGILCTRGQALLRDLPISDGNGNVMGSVRVLDGQEPADVAYSFAEQHGLPPDTADNLVDILCGLSKANPPGPDDLPIKCNRFHPVVFAVPVAATNGSRLGVLEVLSNDEPADAIARFGNKHGLGKDEKANLLKAICESSKLSCSRQQGLIYQASYTLPSGVRERLDFMDGVEPTDLIYDYGQMRNLSLQERKKFLVEVCSEPRRRPNCTRAEPMLLSIPVWETAEKKMGDLEILEGQEPIDMVYAFMEKHDLFQTAPLNTSLLKVVCNSTRVSCDRKRPRRILFSMQASYYGIPHTLQYVQPESDWICESQPRGGRKCIHYMEILSKQFCATHMGDWSGCETRIHEALRTQMEFYEERMWRGKDLYAKLGLVKIASKDEIDSAYNRLVKRFNNETEPSKYEKLKEAYATLSDPEDKFYYDMPCVKLFGCLCGKRKKDGSLTFTTD